MRYLAERWGKSNEIFSWCYSGSGPAGGKPRACRQSAESRVEFSVSFSHSGLSFDWAACPAGELGLDTESIDRFSADTVLPGFKGAEESLISGSFKEAGLASRLALAWTMREAFFKALGCGLAFGLSAAIFGQSTGGGCWVELKPALADYYPRMRGIFLMSGINGALASSLCHLDSARRELDEKEPCARACAGDQFLPPWSQGPVVNVQGLSGNG
jgi:phosphopantetheinyl transferase (holo-ACP synthase)